MLIQLKNIFQFSNDYFCNIDKCVFFIGKDIYCNIILKYTRLWLYVYN